MYVYICMDVCMHACMHVRVYVCVSCVEIVVAHVPATESDICNYRIYTKFHFFQLLFFSF